MASAESQSRLNARDMLDLGIAHMLNGQERKGEWLIREAWDVAEAVAAMLYGAHKGTKMDTPEDKQLQADVLTTALNGMPMLPERSARLGRRGGAGRQS